MRSVVLSMLLAPILLGVGVLGCGLVGRAGPAAAGTCVVELSGAFRCDDGTTFKPNGQGGLKTDKGQTMAPDGSGGYRAPDGSTLKPDGNGGLRREQTEIATTGGSFGAPLQPHPSGIPDLNTSRHVDRFGQAQPTPGRDCRADSFAGFRCK